MQNDVSINFMGNSRFSINIDDATKAAIERLANDEKRTIANMTRILIDEAIKAREAPKNP